MDLYMKNKGNAKSQLSRKVIISSLVELLDSKLLSQVTIKDICDNANISRKTFYRNFENKINVLEDVVEVLTQEYIDTLNVTTDLSFPNIALQVFKWSDANKNFLTKLVNNDLLFIVSDILLEKIVLFYKLRRQELFEKFGERNLENTLTFIFWGVEKYLKKWINYKEEYSALEMKQDFIKISELFSLIINS